MFNNICVCFFTSTKGHFKNKTIYKHTLESLRNKFDGKVFAHIKVTPGEELIADSMEAEIKKIYSSADVFRTLGQWNHVDGSSHYEYLKDIHTLFEQARQYEFTLFLEDDWLFNDREVWLFNEEIGGEEFDLSQELASARSWLRGAPEIFAHRWLRNDPEIIDRTSAVKDFGELLYSQKKEFSFNPCLVRTQEMFLIASFAVKMYNHLHPHCEMAITLAINFLFNGKAKFVFSLKASVTHIGTQDFVNSISNEKS